MPGCSRSRVFAQAVTCCYALKASMPVLFAISVLAFAALLWASLSIARHILQERRRQRARITVPMDEFAEPLPQDLSAGEAAADTGGFVQAAVSAHDAQPVLRESPVTATPAQTPQETSRPGAHKLVYFHWDEDPEEDAEAVDDEAAEQHAAVLLAESRQVQGSPMFASHFSAAQFSGSHKD